MVVRFHPGGPDVEYVTRLVNAECTFGLDHRLSSNGEGTRLISGKRWFDSTQADRFSGEPARLVNTKG